MYSSFGGQKDFTRMQYGTSKAVYYRQNGEGRDTYISSNNGGLNVPREPNLIEIGTFHSKQPRRDIAPTIAPKTVYYTSDGNGRDSYICRDAGGLVAYGAAKDVYTGRFVRDLRSDTRPQTATQRNASRYKTKRDKGDFYLKTQGFSGWSQKGRMRAASTIQKR